MKHLPAIDGLRAIAVLAVVAYHADLPVPAGFVGVDVFFVISGYVITRMLAREHAETGRIDFAAFYARRVRRILPAFAVVVAVTLALSTVLLVPEYRVAVAKSAAAAMAMGANVYFQATTGGYWDASADQMPLLHLWSLAVEEQFYFVWPLLLALLLRFRRAPLLLGAWPLASFALAQHWADAEPGGRLLSDAVPVLGAGRGRVDRLHPTA
jgi:peptidoglycan/LPS O-acetylase OafA/YrhL